MGSTNIVSTSAIVLAMACTALVSPAAMNQPNAFDHEAKKGPENPLETTVQLLEFLRRLKLAFDADAMENPLDFERLSGVHVLEWADPAPDAPKVALRLRTGFSAIDSLLPSEPQADKFHLSYALRTELTSPPKGFTFGVLKVSAISCLTRPDIESVFGRQPLSIQPQPVSPHGGVLPGPQWQVITRLLHPGSGAEMILGYDYEGALRPEATCIATIAIRSRH
jgi:hypothetical protein